MPRRKTARPARRGRSPNRTRSAVRRSAGLRALRLRALGFRQAPEPDLRLEPEEVRGRLDPLRERRPRRKAEVSPDPGAVEDAALLLAGRGGHMHRLLRV